MIVADQQLAVDNIAVELAADPAAAQDESPMPLPMIPTVPTPSPIRHQIGHQPCKMSPIVVSVGWDNRRDSLEITDLRRFLLLHGMQEVSIATYIVPNPNVQITYDCHLRDHTSLLIDGQLTFSPSFPTA
jgi:hypothetical protein